MAERAYLLRSNSRRRPERPLVRVLLALTFAAFGFLLDLALLFLGARLLLVRLALHGELTTVLHLL